MDDNISKQADEIEVLVSIYGNDWSTDSEEDHSFSLKLTEEGTELTLFFHLPENYPSESPPHFEMSAPSLSTEHKTLIHAAINEVYLDNLGETVLYQYIEKVREILQSPEIKNSKIISKPKNSVFAPLEKHHSNIPCPEILHGDVIEDRKSYFQAHVVKISSHLQIPMILSQLKSERKIADATHNILAWRCGAQQDCDDDGEKAAGSRLLKLLSILNIDNTAVIVSRWFGGTHLGADRFRHINNAARQALVMAGLVPQGH